MSRLFDFSHLRGDVFGGLTAGVVALPLALAFGEASGAGPIAGVYGAILVGFFAALFGGTPSQISGPTGPMIVVFAGVFASLSGDVTMVFATVILAGVFQILFGVLGFGQYIRLVPYPVVSGFMSGIGCIIIALQLARLFGHEPEGGGTIPALLEVPAAMADPNYSALGVGLLTLGIVFAWPARWGKYLPSPLVALIVGTSVGLGLDSVPILGNIPTGLPSFIMPSVSGDAFLIMMEAALILAILGAIDSLLTSLVADNMTRTRHDSNRELIGQGVGNMAAGFFGGIPGAGATMRTVVNIRTGGVTRLSGVLHAVFLLAVVLVLAPLASQIPHAVLAGILVKVGYYIVDFSYLKRAHKGPRFDLILMVMVLSLTVFVDLITAVAAGVVVAAIAYVKQVSDAQLALVAGETDSHSQGPSDREVALLNECGDHLTYFDFGGPLSFGAAADLGHHVRERLSPQHHVALALDFSRVPFMDVSALRAIETIAQDAAHAGKHLFVCGINEAVAQSLDGMGVSDYLPADTRFDTRFEALSAAKDWIFENIPTDDIDRRDDQSKKPVTA
ncbi:MAG: SulP family inorganic anion transporter [Halieaceae bacterium]|nr:SulP family inorganic anion transporter [Halieaceae bacterium]